MVVKPKVIYLNETHGYKWRNYITHVTKKTFNASYRNLTNPSFFINNNRFTQGMFKYDKWPIITNIFTIT